VILPSKHLSQERALLTVGGRLLQCLSQPRTVSSLWEAVSREVDSTPLRYDWFVLALDLLFLTNAIEFRDGRLNRRSA
jgi:hypothetical protein